MVPSNSLERGFTVLSMDREPVQFNHIHVSLNGVRRFYNKERPHSISLKVKCTFDSEGKFHLYPSNVTSPRFGRNIFVENKRRGFLR